MFKMGSNILIYMLHCEIEMVFNLSNRSVTPHSGCFERGTDSIEGIA